MAENQEGKGDPLTFLRQAIANSSQPVQSTSTSADTPASDLASATHLIFSSPSAAAFSVDIKTRFVGSSGNAVDLRSVFFAWQHKDDPPTEYNSAVEALNATLAEKGVEAKVHNLLFVERLDLVTWLEGDSNESQYITALESDKAASQAPTQAAAGAAAAGATASSAAARVSKPIDPRLQEIYNNERRMGDRNSVLRGIKPTDFSHVRKTAEIYLKAGRSKPGAAPSAAANPSAALVSLPKNKSSRRPDPIILLSPSASSLLRMSNIRSFLESGVYAPPDSASLAASTSLLHISRNMPSIDQSRAIRFILVDSTDQFKPDYWNRVVAVFTTGQAWQFKGYKWQSPQELFSHVLGIYIGWRGENVPDTVKGWGRGVVSLQVDKWRGEGVGRWRDREVVESFWSRVEEAMRRTSWSSGGPAAK